MSLMDMDDPEGAVREAWRVLEPRSRFCVALVHPLNSGGRFESREPDAAFLVEDYFTPRRYVEDVERDGFRMTFTSQHRSLEGWLRPLEEAGFLLEALREVPDLADPPGDRWRRIPLFAHVRALKP